MKTKLALILVLWSSVVAAGRLSPEAWQRCLAEVSNAVPVGEQGADGGGLSRYIDVMCGPRPMDRQYCLTLYRQVLWECVESKPECAAALDGLSRASASWVKDLARASRRAFDGHCLKACQAGDLPDFGRFAAEVCRK